MKKFIAIILMVSMLVLGLGCGNSKTIDGVKYNTYGLFNKEKKSPNIEYELIVGNLLWSVLLCETLVMPIYFFGFSIYEPVGPVN